jgi:hypothetical protein
MLLAFASLGAGVTAEQNDERVVDLEDLGILELSLSDDGVVEAMVTKDAFLSFMSSDEAALLAIESVAMSVSLGEDGKLVLSDFEIGVGENQSDEISVTLRLSDELIEILHDEDINLEDLLNEVGFGDDLGLDDFTPEVEDDYEEYYGSRIHWADEAYQLRGCQDDYERVMDAEDPADEYYAIYDEMVHDWEEAEELEEESNESDEEDWDSEDSDEGTDEDVEGESGDELDEEHHQQPGDENDREDRDRLDDALDMREDEITQIIVIVNTDGTIADVTVIVIYEDGEYDMFVFTMLLEDLRERLANFDGIVVWNWIPTPPLDPVDDEGDVLDELEERCLSGTMHGTFVVDEDGNGTLRGQIYNDAGELVTNMWGGFNTDGFVRGLAGDNVSTPIAQWKAVSEDGRFNGLWKMVDAEDDSRGILKGIYELNDNRTGGEFHGKWKAVGCHNELGHEDDAEWITPDRDDVEPRHTPIQIDAERVDDARQLDKAPKDKALMDKLGDVMDKPIVEDSEGGAIVDIGDAAVGSTLGTIALLGAGFIRRRITGGI